MPRKTVISTLSSSSHWQIALRIEAESYAPNELIIKPGDPALFMFTIRRGLAAKAGAVMATGMHFGDDFLLTSYFRPYTVRALTYLDCFRLNRSVLAPHMFQHKQFPSFQVRVSIQLELRPSQLELRPSQLEWLRKGTICASAIPSL